MSNITPGMSETQNAVDFVNKEVLTQDVNPKVGSSATMIDQSVGMMVQDLQVFLKGFEQIGLVALTKLVNNFLTYGNYYNPANLVPRGGGDDLDARYTKTPEAKPQVPTSLTSIESDGKEVIQSLFKMVTEYGEAKSKINALIANPEASRNLDEIYTKPPSKETPQQTVPADTPTEAEIINTPLEHKPIEDEKPKTKEKTYWFRKNKKS